jgi:cytochrome c biogenesis protein CcmG/thiol:disulfide interchange protein DsbE
LASLRRNTLSHSRIKHHGKRNLAILAGTSVLLGLIVLAILSLPPAESVNVGQQAPNFQLDDINGASFNLYGMLNHPVFIEFMSTGCIHCLNEAPTLSQLYSIYSSRVNFVSISIFPDQDTIGVLQSYAHQHNMLWTWARDTGGVALKYGITGTPTMLVLDRNGMVKAKFLGETDGNTLSNALSSLV